MVDGSDKDCPVCGRKLEAGAGVGGDAAHHCRACRLSVLTLNDLAAPDAVMRLVTAIREAVPTVH